MSDTPPFRELVALIGDDLSAFVLLDGFDLELVGFPCDQEIERDQKWECPFKPAPGCGHVPGPDCPLMQRLKLIFPPCRTMQ
jgi:hypothetical protein